jgi:hypothetical protein
MAVSNSPSSYTFHHSDACMMCGSPAEEHHVLGKRLNQSQGLFPEYQPGITTTVVKCTDCGLIYADPMPIPQTVLDHYGSPPQDYWTQSMYVDLDDMLEHSRHQFERMRELMPQSSNWPKPWTLDLALVKA